MGDVTNCVSTEWQSLAVPHERRGNRGMARTKASLACAAGLRRLLTDYGGTDIAGCLLDSASGSRPRVDTRAGNEGDGV